MIKPATRDFVSINLTLGSVLTVSQNAKDSKKKAKDPPIKEQAGATELNWLNKWISFENGWQSLKD